MAGRKWNRPRPHAIDVMSQPLLSICIPTFNRERLLGECLRVVLPEADELGLPVIVYDNASGEGTTELLDNLRNEFPNLETWRQDQNVGFDLNHLALIGKVRTRYAWLLGDDDIIEPGALKAVRDLLARDDALELVLLNAITTDNDMRPTGRQFAFHEDRIVSNCRELLRTYPDKLTFGMMVIDAGRFNQMDAARYVDTAHLYAGGVLDHLAQNFERTGHNHILITGKAWVRLRQGVRPWTLGAGDISVRQIPQFYMRLPQLYAVEAEAIRQRVVGAVRLIPALVRMRAAGWLDHQRAAELTPLFAGPHAWRLQLAAAMPRWLARTLSATLSTAPAIRRELKRLRFSMGGAR
jgi:hypothetical protein